jgi:hypothetical protein
MHGISLCSAKYQDARIFHIMQRVALQSPSFPLVFPFLPAYLGHFRSLNQFSSLECNLFFEKKIAAEMKETRTVAIFVACVATTAAFVPCQLPSTRILVTLQRKLILSIVSLSNKPSTALSVMSCYAFLAVNRLHHTKCQSTSQFLMLTGLTTFRYSVAEHQGL